MVKKITEIVFLAITLLCTINLSITYSKYMLSKNINGSIYVPKVDYCIKEGITSLSECMLIMENYSPDAESAKLYISSKGSADSKNIAPLITYSQKESIQENSEKVFSISSSFIASPTYKFNTETGGFTLTNAVTISEMSDKYLNYYFCSILDRTTCYDIYQILDYDLINKGDYNIINITKAKYLTYKTANSFESEIGLYTAQDEYGTSYFYRGAVKNNYVNFAGYKWRIIRQNGDGTIRLIYSGLENNLSNTGVDTTIGTAQYNKKSHDHTYGGYMYNENFSLFEDKNIATFRSVTENSKYYFADSYSFDENTQLFSLTGNFLQGTWKANYQNILKNYPYTCLSTNASFKCNYILKAVEYKAANTINVNYITYGSTNYEDTLINNKDSSIKQTLDTWYIENILNKKDSNGVSYANYVTDNIFCNDRSIYQGQGFNPGITTVYGFIGRQTNILTCPQFADKFSVGNSGNGALTYPIGLITADEINLAGAKNRTVNKEFYLYNALVDWTMTLYDYANYRGLSRITVLNTSGTYDAVSVSTSRYVRPVINLKSDIEITEGDGSINNPYIVTLR